MRVEYYQAKDVKKMVNKILTSVNLHHIDPNKVLCYSSKGSKAKRTLARIHALPRIWQNAFNLSPHYLIEVISERFAKLNDDEKIKTLIHELLHIPVSFGGGFRYHGQYVNRLRVEEVFKMFKTHAKNN